MKQHLFTVRVRSKVQDRAAHKVQEGFLYKVQWPFTIKSFFQDRYNGREFQIFKERYLIDYKVQLVKTASTLERTPTVVFILKILSSFFV